MKDIRPWKVLSRRTEFRNRHALDVSVESVELPDGRIVDDYYQVKTPDAAIVAAQTPEKTILAIRGYIHGARKVAISLPGGNIQDAEAPIDAARRELLEETGYIAASWKHLGSFVRHANQGAGWDHLFYAAGATRRQLPVPGDLEEMELLFLSWHEMREALLGGVMVTSSHAIAVCMALLTERIGQ